MYPPWKNTWRSVRNPSFLYREKGQSSLTKWICSLKLLYQHVPQRGFLVFFLTCQSQLIKLHEAVKQIKIKRLIRGSVPVVISRDNPFIACGKWLCQPSKPKVKYADQVGVTVFFLWNYPSLARLLMAQSSSSSSWKEMQTCCGRSIKNDRGEMGSQK